MPTEKGCELRDEIDRVFDGSGRGKTALGDRIAAECPIEDLDYILHYLLCREEGGSATLADMLASRQGPALMTDAVFLEGHCNGNQFAGSKIKEAMGDAYRRQADAAGVSITGKVYLGGLAAFPGDPKAWVSDRGDVKRVLTERGWGSEGAVNVAPAIKPPKRERMLPNVLAGGAKAQLYKRLKAKGLSGDLLKGA